MNQAAIPKKISAMPVLAPKAKPSLVFAWTYVEWGGAQVYFLGIIEAARKDYDVRVVLPRESNPDIIRFLSAMRIKFELIDVKLDLQPAETVSRKLERQLNRIKTEYALFDY